LVSPSIVSTVTLGLDLRLSVHNVISGTEVVQSLAWSPYGDGFIYVTVSGKLYWSDLTGANRTQLYSYTNQFYDLDVFEKQKPAGDTFYIIHMGESTAEA